MVTFSIATILVLAKKKCHNVSALQLYVIATFNGVAIHANAMTSAVATSL